NLSHAANVELLIDTSRSMRGASLDNAIAAARQFLVSKPQSDQVEVIKFGNTAVRLTGFSASPTDADQQLRSLTVDRHSGTALYDAVTLAAGQLSQQSSGARLIVLVTDGKDVSSSATLASAVH